MSPSTPQRKADHLAAFRSGGVPARDATTWLEHVHLIHQALPERSLGALDLSVTFANRRFEAPLFVSGMTGGTEHARDINRALARVAQKLGLGFGLGSQRAMLENPALTDTFHVREAAPEVFVAGNLGAVQAAALPSARVLDLVRAVDANALCVHLNAAQELVQPEGERGFEGIAEGLARLVCELPVPVIVKETGGGLSREAARKLVDCGVRYADVAGLGGTSWVGVEARRQGREDDPELAALWDWGLPTAASLLEVRGSGLACIGSGGIRTGLDAARALALGAEMVGMAAPLLGAYYEAGEAGVEARLNATLDGLRRVMLLSGAATLAELRRVPRVLLGPLGEWCRARELQP